MTEPAPKFSRPPTRVVSLVPSITQSLLDLGVGASVVGATDYCPVVGAPTVGGPKDPDLRQIIALGPDLVIANREENRRVDVEALQASGITVWVTFPRTAAQGIEMLWEIVRLNEIHDRAASLRTLETALAWTEGARPAGGGVRVFYPIWRDPWMTVSADTYAHDLLRICGGQNVATAAESGRYPTVTLAQVRDWAPEVILLPSEPFQFGPGDLEAFYRYPEIPAVRDKRLRLVDAHPADLVRNAPGAGAARGTNLVVDLIFVLYMIKFRKMSCLGDCRTPIGQQRNTG